jgi:AcrR family transcriptional regulator
MDTDESRNPQSIQSDVNTPGSRLSIREEQKLRTRDRILDAAFEIFQKFGFRAATVDEIMKHAGANRATFYLHFKDKIDIAAGLGRRRGTAVAERFRRLDNLAAPTCADIRAWLEQDVADRRKDNILIHVIHEAMTTDPRFGQEYFDYCGRIADRVMVNTVARWPENRRSLVRARIVCLFVMLDRVEFHLLCQNLEFGGYDPLDAIAKILWNELFSSHAHDKMAASGI